MMQSRTRTSYKSHYPPLSPYNPQHSPSFPLYIPFYLYITSNNNYNHNYTTTYYHNNNNNTRVRVMRAKD